MKLHYIAYIFYVYKIHLLNMDMKFLLAKCIFYVRFSKIGKNRTNQNGMQLCQMIRKIKINFLSIIHLIKTLKTSTRTSIFVLLKTKLQEILKILNLELQ
jgi:hypothetical protein